MMISYIPNENKISKQEKGFSLIELLLALTLSLLILSIISTIYLMTQRQLRSLLALNKLQQTIHLLSEIFHSEIHQAGYIGCPKLTENFPFKTFSPYDFTSQNKFVATTHSLTTRSASAVHNNLIQPMTSLSVLYVFPEPVFSKGDILIISSCQRAELLEVKQSVVSQGRQIIRIKKPLHNLYDKEAELAQLEINTFYIENTGRQTDQGQSVWALYRQDRKGQTLELVEGVQDLTIRPEKEGVELDFVLTAPPLTKSWHMYIGL